MANSSRNPVSQRFTYVTPAGTARGAPGLPQPGPAAQDAADALPFLNYSTGPGLCQQPNLTAVGGNPGMAGPLPTMPTTPMQDFGVAAQPDRTGDGTS